MKNEQRPVRTGTTPRNGTKGSSAAPGPRPVPSITPEGGYNPYDTVTTRVSDILRYKPKTP